MKILSVVAIILVLIFLFGMGGSSVGIQADSINKEGLKKEVNEEFSPLSSSIETDRTQGVSQSTSYSYDLDYEIPEPTIENVTLTGTLVESNVEGLHLDLIANNEAYILIDDNENRQIYSELKKYARGEVEIKGRIKHYSGGVGSIYMYGTMLYIDSFKVIKEPIPLVHITAEGVAIYNDNESRYEFTTGEETYILKTGQNLYTHLSMLSYYFNKKLKIEGYYLITEKDSNLKTLHVDDFNLIGQKEEDIESEVTIRGTLIISNKDEERVKLISGNTIYILSGCIEGIGEHYEDGTLIEVIGHELVNPNPIIEDGKQERYIKVTTYEGL